MEDLHLRKELYKTFIDDLEKLRPDVYSKWILGDGLPKIPQPRAPLVSTCYLLTISCFCTSYYLQLVDLLI
jgi:hypothetical protein